MKLPLSNIPQSEAAGLGKGRARSSDAALQKRAFTLTQ